MTSFDHQFFDSDDRASQTLSNDRCQNILYKAVFEHFKKIRDVAAILLASKSFQNSSFGANFIVNFVVDKDSILLLESVLSPSPCFSMQFVPSLHIKQSRLFSEQTDEKVTNFVGELVKTKYFRLSLRSLKLQYFTNELLSFFFGSSTSNAWPQLQNLKIEGCGVNDSVLEIISKNALQLRTATFSDNREFTDVGLVHISQLSSITSLELSSCISISDACLNSICTNLVGITTLSLAGSRTISDVGLEHIVKHAGITSLDLSWNDDITDAGLELLSGLVGLTSLNLSSCDAITDDGMGHLAKLSSVTSLWFSNRNITDVGLEWISNLSRITFLDLNRCRLITDASLECISKLTGITSLNINRCSLITDAGIELISKLVGITCLDLSFCKKITDAGLEHVSRLANITSLDLECCYQIGDSGLDHFSKLSNITALRLYQTDKISIQARKKFAVARPNCRIYYEE